MLLSTVGIHKQQFRGRIQRMDELEKDGIISFAMYRPEIVRKVVS